MCRIATASDGAANPCASRTYQYDAAGHVLGLRFGDGILIEYDYGCWAR
jgi:hypothetical protein